MSYEKGIIEIFCCEQCPYYYYKDSYGEELAHRCNKLFNIRPYERFDECINPKTYWFKIDKNVH